MYWDRKGGKEKDATVVEEGGLRKHCLCAEWRRRCLKEKSEGFREQRRGNYDQYFNIAFVRYVRDERRELYHYGNRHVVYFRDTDERPDEGSKYTALYSIRGVALGRTTLQFVATQKEHVQVFSQAREIQV